jgi:hypothetical protein
MTKIKICGLTLPGEAAFLNEIHADYAGMVVFFPGKSRRCVTTCGHEGDPKRAGAFRQERGRYGQPNGG